MARTITEAKCLSIIENGTVVNGSTFEVDNNRLIRTTVEDNKRYVIAIIDPADRKGHISIAKVVLHSYLK